MIQITEKLFAVPVPEDANYRISYKRIEYISQSTGIEAITLPFDCKEIGIVTKDTIDFDVEPILDKHNDICRHTMESQGIFYKDYTVGDYIFSIPEASFRSLLTSKGCNPNAKHLIIEKNMNRQDLSEMLKDGLSISMENSGSWLSITIYFDGEPVATADERLKVED